MTDCSKKRIFIFAGEQSGDLHGSHLLHALNELHSNLSFEGVCGPRMRAFGLSGPANMEEFEVMGLTDVILALPKLFKKFYTIRDYILHARPDMVVLIDYPGFNLRLAKALRQKGYRGKIVQYVSPSVWAWGQHRIAAMAETLDLLLLIYPFEPAYFANTFLKTIYVGNPIQEYVCNYVYDNDWQHKLGIRSQKNLIAMFPGSRPSEITRNLPILLDAAQRLKHIKPETQFAISCPNETAVNLIKMHSKSMAASFQENLFQVPKHFTYELMRDCHTAVAKSGTVTLELALHKCPTVAMYKLTTLNRLYAKYVLKLKLPFYCIVNILANRQVFPEFIEKDLTAEGLFQQLRRLNEEGKERSTCLQACEELCHTIGKHQASFMAAKSILKILPC